MKVSIIIPNYNGERLLPACLDAVQAQTMPADQYEVIVVDDASTDASLQVLTGYREVRVVQHERNRRFAAAVNSGVAVADGDLIALLNTDVVAAPGWLAALVEAADTMPDYDLFSSHIRFWPAAIDDPLTYFAAHPDEAQLHTSGDYYQWNGIPDSRGVWQVDRGQYIAGPIFGPCAAAALYRRSLLTALAEDNPAGGPLDERLVMYCEDVDLNIRAIRRGAKAWYVLGALVYHQLSATGGGPLASYYVGRNIILLAAKYWERRMWGQHWGRFVGAQLREVGRSLRHLREPAARARLRGIVAGLRLFLCWRKLRPPGDDARLAAAMDRFGKGS